MNSTKLGYILVREGYSDNGVRHIESAYTGRRDFIYYEDILYMVVI